MFGKPVRDFRPYETALQVTDGAEITAIVRSFVHAPSLHHLCVVDGDGRLLGLINRKRLFKSVFSHHVAPDSRVSKLLFLHTAETSRDIMFTDVMTTTEDEEIDAVISRMIARNIRELPVVDGEGRVIGFLTLLMLMQKWLAGQDGG